MNISQTRDYNSTCPFWWHQARYFNGMTVFKLDFSNNLFATLIISSQGFKLKCSCISNSIYYYRSATELGFNHQIRGQIVLFVPLKTK